MAKRKKWNPQPFHLVESLSELRLAIMLAQLGELIYKEISSRELRQSDTSSIATKADNLHLKSERQAANG